MDKRTTAMLAEIRYARAEQTERTYIPRQWMTGPSPRPATPGDLERQAECVRQCREGIARRSGEPVPPRWPNLAFRQVAELDPEQRQAWHEQVAL